MAIIEQHSSNINIKVLNMENLGVTELKLKEMMSIDGGKPVSYYLGYALGALAGTAVSFVAGLIGGLEAKHI
jgi:hypothetical protein